MPPELWADWLDTDTINTDADVEALLTAVRASSLPEMATPEVSPAVNTVRNSSPELIRPVADSASTSAPPLDEQAGCGERVDADPDPGVDAGARRGGEAP